MCGIVGYIGPREAASLLIEGLRRLEYRGYDSAGIAVAGNGDGLPQTKTGRQEVVTGCVERKRSAANDDGTPELDNGPRQTRTARRD